MANRRVFLVLAARQCKTLSGANITRENNSDNCATKKIGHSKYEKTSSSNSCDVRNIKIADRDIEIDRSPRPRQYMYLRMNEEFPVYQ